MYDVVYFSLATLLSLLSTQLYHGLYTQPPSTSDSFGCDNLFLDAILIYSEKLLRLGIGRSTGITDVLPVKFVKGLLTHTLQALPPPMDSIVFRLYHHSQNNSLMKTQYFPTTIWTSISSLLLSPIQLLAFLGRLLPSTVGRSMGSPSSRSTQIEPRMTSYPLSDRCAATLCLLIMNRCPSSSFNAFRESFCLLHDEKCADFITMQHSVMGGHIDYEQIATAVPALAMETHILFIYILLQKHPSYLEAIVNTGSPSLKVIFGTLLTSLYKVNELNSVDMVYVLLIDILLLVQDSRVRTWMSNETDMQHWNWYKERTLKFATYTDMAVLCILRTISHALFFWKDSYILSNCFAILVDIVSSVRNLHVYASERLLEVLVRVSKALRLPQSQDAAIDALRDTKDILISMIAVMISGDGGLRNVNLLYAMIHDRDQIVDILTGYSLSSHQSRVRLQNTSSNPAVYLLNLLEEYLQLLELSIERKNVVDAKAAVAELIKILEANPCPNIAVELPMGFTYEEGENSDSFFIPCCWMAVTKKAADLPLEVESISLFEPSVIGRGDASKNNHELHSQSQDAENAV